MLLLIFCCFVFNLIRLADFELMQSHCNVLVVSLFFYFPILRLSVCVYHLAKEWFWAFSKFESHQILNSIFILLSPKSALFSIFKFITSGNFCFLISKNVFKCVNASLFLHFVPFFLFLLSSVTCFQFFSAPPTHKFVKTSGFSSGFNFASIFFVVDCFSLFMLFNHIFTFISIKEFSCFFRNKLVCVLIITTSLIAALLSVIVFVFPCLDHDFAYLGLISMRIFSFGLFMHSHHHSKCHLTEFS